MTLSCGLSPPPTPASLSVCFPGQPRQIPWEPGSDPGPGPHPRIYPQACVSLSSPVPCLAAASLLQESAFRCPARDLFLILSAPWFTPFVYPGQDRPPVPSLQLRNPPSSRMASLRICPSAPTLSSLGDQSQGHHERRLMDCDGERCRWCLLGCHANWVKMEMRNFISNGFVNTK